MYISYEGKKVLTRESTFSPKLRSLFFAESCQAEQKKSRKMKTLVKTQNQLGILPRTKASKKNVLSHDSKILVGYNK